MNLASFALPLSLSIFSFFLFLFPSPSLSLSLPHSHLPLSTILVVVFHFIRATNATCLISRKIKMGKNAERYSLLKMHLIAISEYSDIKRTRFVSSCYSMENIFPPMAIHMFPYSHSLHSVLLIQYL